MKTTSTADAAPMGYDAQLIQINTLYDSFEGRRSDWHAGAKAARLSDNELWQDLVFEARDHKAREFLNTCMQPSDVFPCSYYTELLPEDTAKLCAGLLGVGTANEVQGLDDLSEAARDFLRKRALWAVLCVDPSFWECDPNELCF